MLSLDNTERYFVYFLCDPRKNTEYTFGNYSLLNEPYYCGKGTASRVYGKKNKKTQDKTNKILSLGHEPIYVQIGPFDENTAFALEEYFVNLIGRHDLAQGPLFNLQDGGFGGSRPSEESKQKMSDSHKGKTWEDIMGYDAATARRANLSKRMVENNINRAGHQAWNLGKTYTLGARSQHSISVEIDGILYESIKEAELKTGISRYKIRQIIRKGK